MRPGLLIRVKGIINNNGKRFYIDIANGPEDEDRPFHMSVNQDSNVVIRNNYLNQKWVNEERTGGFPFKYGVPFEILILGDQTKFRVAIDGVHFCDFSHRVSLANAKYLSIKEDVQISYIGIGEDPTYFDQQLQQQEHEGCTPSVWKGYPHY